MSTIDELRNETTLRRQAFETRKSQIEALPTSCRAGLAAPPNTSSPKGSSMHSFRIIVKTPDHLVGYDDQIPGKSGWIEHENDGRWLVVVCDLATGTPARYRRSSLASAISLFSLKLAEIEA